MTVDIRRKEEEAGAQRGPTLQTKPVRSFYIDLMKYGTLGRQTFYQRREGYRRDNRPLRRPSEGVTRSA